MLGKTGDEIAPSSPIFWRRNDRFVPEGMKRLFRRKLSRSEAQFDEGPHLVLEEAIVDLIDVREVVNRPVVGPLVVDADFVVEDGVEAYIFEAGGRFDVAKIAPIVLSQRENGATGSKHPFPEMREGPVATSQLYLDRFR